MSIEDQNGHVSIKEIAMWEEQKEDLKELYMKFIVLAFISILCGVIIFPILNLQSDVLQLNKLCDSEYPLVNMFVF